MRIESLSSGFTQPPIGCEFLPVLSASEFKSFCWNGFSVYRNDCPFQRSLAVRRRAHDKSHLLTYLANYDSLVTECIVPGEGRSEPSPGDGKGKRGICNACDDEGRGEERCYEPYDWDGVGKRATWSRAILGPGEQLRYRGISTGAESSAGRHRGSYGYGSPAGREYDGSADHYYGADIH